MDPSSLEKSLDSVFNPPTEHLFFELANNINDSTSEIDIAVKIKNGKKVARVNHLAENDVSLILCHAFQCFVFNILNFKI